MPHETKGIAALVGTPHLDRDLFNACAVLSDGEVKAVYKKRFLPNYGVFDEDRYFQSGRDLLLLRLGETLVGVTICEDIWQPGPPATDLALAGAHVVANVSASPFHLGKGREREEMLATRARDNACWVALVNAVGGQDELVFDGQSLVLDQDGWVVARGPAFEEALVRRGHRADDGDRPPASGRAPASACATEHARRARRRSTSARRPRASRGRPSASSRPSSTGSRRCAARSSSGSATTWRRTAFDDVVLGMSGGIDSALTAAIAVEALGPERVVCVSMPSRYSSSETRSTRAWRPRASARASSRSRSSRSPRRSRSRWPSRSPAPSPDVAEENVQARIRGTLLMALSNKFGWLLVATGNKSELSVGYATLYGDMAGGFAPLKDVFKTDVFLLAQHLNERAGRELVPASVIERAPSAELRPDQLDEDSLPPYPKLDGVLEAYVELDQSREELAAGRVRSRDRRARALALVDRAEYKRRQAPPGVKLRPKAFGRDRRVPITNRWVG